MKPLADMEPINTSKHQYCEICGKKLYYSETIFRYHITTGEKISDFVFKCSKGTVKMGFGYIFHDVEVIKPPNYEQYA